MRIVRQRCRASCCRSCLQGRRCRNAIAQPNFRVAPDANNSLALETIRSPRCQRAVNSDKSSLVTRGVRGGGGGKMTTTMPNGSVSNASDSGLGKSYFPPWPLYERSRTACPPALTYDAYTLPGVPTSVVSGGLVEKTSAVASCLALYDQASRVAASIPARATYVMPCLSGALISIRQQDMLSRRKQKTCSSRLLVFLLPGSLR